MAKAAEDAGREFTPEERTAIKHAMEEAKARKNAVAVIDGDAGIVAELDALSSVAGEIAKAGVDVGQIGETLGERITKSKHFADWIESIAPTGEVPEKSRIHSPAFAMGQKDLVTGLSDTSAGALVATDFRGLLDGLGAVQRPLTLVDLITRGTTGSDVVEFARVTAITNAAAPIAGGDLDRERHEAGERAHAREGLGDGEDDRSLHPRDPTGSVGRRADPDADRRVPPVRPRGGTRRSGRQRRRDPART